MVYRSRKRGFRIGRKLVKVFQWMNRRLRRNCNPTCRSLSSRGSTLLRLGKYLARRAKRLCSLRSASRGYIQLGRENPVGYDVPKGHLAVYVGRSMDDTSRVVVPVMYFNHPLFGELLKEAEKAHGYNHPGGITLPCGVSELERIQSRIAEGSRCRQRAAGHVSRWR